MKRRDIAVLGVVLFGLVLWLMFPGVLLPQASKGKPQEKRAVVDMGSYKVSAPSGRNWKVDLKQNSGRVRFTRSQEGSVLAELALGSQQQETTVLVMSVVEPPWEWPYNVDEIMNGITGVSIETVDPNGRVLNSYNLKLQEKGESERGDKKLLFARFQAAVPVENNSSQFVILDQLEYYYYPPDFRKTHRYFRFESLFTRPAGGLKIFKNPGAEPILEVIDSLEIVDPLKSVPGAEGELLRAAVSGDVDAARRAVDKGAKADAAAAHMTALAAAALYGHRDIVEFLLGQGADVNKADTEGGRTPLHQALIGGEPEIARILIRAGADPDPRTMTGYSPLMYASILGFADLVSIFLECGADLNAKTNDGETALILTAKCGSVEMTRLLVTKGADLNAQTNTEWTALMHAVHMKHSDLVRLILESGADVGHKTATGNTALMIAIGEGDVKLVRALIEKGADINSGTNEGGWTPLLHVLSREQPDTIAMTLIEAGADVNAKLDDGTTVLMLASRNASSITVKRILGKGVDVNAKNANGQTALDYAKSKKRADIVPLLKAAGAKG